MNGIVQILRNKAAIIVVLALVSAAIMMPHPVLTQQSLTPPEPLVAIHVSELTQAFETMRAKSPTPTGSGTTGHEWWHTEWHYFVMAESLEEALRSDGTPFIEVSDADIAAGRLLQSDGSPRYPILISLASEAVADNEVDPLREYVSAGGFLFAGSSAFTRNPDGTTRGDFALGDEMGLHMATAGLRNWYKNLHFSKIADHRLASGIPAGTIAWRMPLSSEEIPLGVSPSHSIHGSHWVFQVTATGGATVIANGDTGPLLATTHYGKGNFIYHGAMQPLIGHTIYDPSLYAYLVYRHAIEWAFEAADLPIVRLSPWPYEYDAAFNVRHDFENDAASIGSVEDSASYEHSLGVKGNYYFCTGTLREEIQNKSTVIAGLRSAVTNYGATIGSHNGGLKNPLNTTLSIGDFDYWHWGPDEVLNITPKGYASGRAYAQSSMSSSFQDIEGWLSGVDNGRAGCGSKDNCPRTWVAPYFNSAREDSYDIVENMGAVATMGEQKIGPFPHWTLSYETPGTRFSHVSIPASDWYVGAEIPGALEWGHTTASMRAAVDFYYNLGASIELYGHLPSNGSNLMGQYVGYSVSKPRMWAANAVEIFDWWQVRSNAIVTPAYGITGSTAIVRAVITGTPGPGTAVEVALPNMDVISGLQVFIDGASADSADYRTVGNTVKIRVGASTSTVEVRYPVSTVDNPVPALAGLSPSSVTAGSSAFTLTVSGSNFVGASVVQWNGISRATTYVSPTRLTAAIAAADIAVAGTAIVTVFTPAPGGGVSNAQTFSINDAQGGGTWTQTDWVGGGGQSIWADQTRYSSSNGIDNSNNGEIGLSYGSAALFSDDFSDGALSPWIAALGTWSVTGGVMRGTGSANQYSYAYYSPAAQWTDYTVQGRIQLPAGSFGGGIGGRVNTSTGAHYGAWVYPTGSSGGSNMLKLWKFRGWTSIGAAMQQVSLPAVGTGWHTLQMTFTANRIQVYYDGVLKIDVTDNNFDSRAPYLSGGISADWWTSTLPYTITVDDISVVRPNAYGSNGTLLSSSYDGGDGVQWQALSWDATTDPGTNVCVKTRTADSSDQIANASWSNCYGTSGSEFMSENRRWVQYQVELATGDTSISPVFNEIRISYRAGSSSAPVPVINSLSPTSATAGDSGLTLTVTGTGFINGSTVQWNGSNRTTTYVSATQLTAAVLASDITTAGTATVTVFTPAPGGGTSNAQPFTINLANNPVPVTANLSPTSANAGSSGFTLTVNGSSFINGSLVQWNGSNRTTTYVSATRLTAAVLASDITTAGTATVTVFTPAPGGGTSNAQPFTINLANNPVPATASLSPASATAGGAGFTLTVNGSSFINSSTVQWNGANRTTIYVSATQLTAAILASDITTAGTATVTVFTPAPGGGTSNAQTFTINAATNPVPATAGLSPTSANAGSSGFTLTVNGSSFINGSTVQWNGANRTTTYVSATQLTAAVLASDITTAGTATVTVFTPAPGGGTSNAQTFTINAATNPVPATASLSPTSATAGSSGFTLTVNGSSFINGSTVQWNGANRTTTYVSATQLTAAIPATDLGTAGTATVTVFTPAPGGGTSNAQTFAINTSIPILFSDDFSDGALSPWVAALGTWSVTGGVMRGTGSANQYSYAYYSPSAQWTDYTVQGRIQLPAGSFGGGIGGRVNTSTGAHYGAWVYPTGSAGGSNMLKLWKFRGWTSIGAAMQQVSLPAVGTGWHTLQMTFTANRIQVYYDGVLKIDVTDNNFDSRAPYASGGISADWWTWSLPYTITVDDISVVSP